MINGITFDRRNVRAKDDAQVRRKMFDDGILSGCGMSYSGKDLTIAVGSFLVSGRQIEVSVAETITSDTTEANGYGRLRFIIDLTAEPSETVFNQYRWEWDYQAANSGWPALTQEDINGEGDTYEVAMATVSFSASNISGVLATLPTITKAVPAVDYTASLSTTWTGSTAPYTQNVTVTGLSAKAKIFVGLADNATDAEYAAAAAAQLMCTAKAANQVTITARGTVPTIAIPIIVRVVS